MLYAVIMRFDSLREIMPSIQAEARKLCHFSNILFKGVERHPNTARPLYIRWLSGILYIKSILSDNNVFLLFFDILIKETFDALFSCFLELFRIEFDTGNL